MNRCGRALTAIVALVATIASPLTQAKNLFDPARASYEEHIRLNDMTVSGLDIDGGGLTLRAGTDEKWPGIRLLPVQSKPWNLTDWSALAIDIVNHDDAALTVHVRIDNPLGTRGLREPWTTQKYVVAPRASTTLHARLRRASTLRPKLKGMQTFPQGLDDDGIDPAKVSSVLIFLARSDAARTFSVGTMRAVEPYVAQPWEQLSSKQFFPFVDEFGQFRHQDWDKKIATPDALLAQRRLEDTNLARNASPPKRSEFGGWKDGPRVAGTGHFTVTQRKGKWWLVDPQGYLFWSHGLGVVRTQGPTSIEKRERYFPTIVSKETDTPFHGTHDPDSPDAVTTFDFAHANLFKKYGANWRQLMAQRMPRRLKSWGFNTYGLWSDNTLTQAGQLPYAQWVYYRSPAIEGSYPTGRMVDMWHEKFIPHIKNAAHKLDALNDDPWLLGVFVDNELRWGDAGGFSNSVMRSPATQPAKRQLLSFLQGKYANLDELNRAWSLHLDTWESFLDESARALRKAPTEDVNEFYALSADHYYRSVAQIVRAHAPDKLYLCSRFNGRFPVPEQAAAKYCDVISYNLYRTSVADFRALDRTDKPVLISEWHFGTLDRGMFGPGLVEVTDQDARAKAYEHYLTGALNNPLIVGAHWFQYLDEPLTGRPQDGENFQIGFVSVTDTPYARLTRAARRMGESMYAIRSENP